MPASLFEGTFDHRVLGRRKHYDLRCLYKHRVVFLDGERVGASEPSQHEPRDHQARPTHEQSNAPGNPRQPQPDEPQQDFDFNAPKGERPNEFGSPSPRELRRDNEETERN